MLVNHIMILKQYANIKFNVSHKLIHGNQIVNDKVKPSDDLVTQPWLEEAIVKKSHNLG